MYRPAQSCASSFPQQTDRRPNNRSSCDNTPVVSAEGITVFRSIRSDLAAWRVLALEVEQLFGAPMANNGGWIARLQRHIERGTAWCASIAPLQEMVGGMWLSSDADTVTIAWLAVRREARRKGVGSALVEQALAEAGGRTVRVVTFGDRHPLKEESDAARDLYRRLGFKQSFEVLPVARDGTPRVVFSRNAPQ